MASLRGFGLTFDVERGMARNWYVGADGIGRWADNDQPMAGCPKCNNPSNPNVWHNCPTPPQGGDDGRG